MRHVRELWTGVPAGTLLVIVLLALSASACRSAPQAERSPEQVRSRLLEELRPVALKNCTLARFGSASAGGYLLCENLLAQSRATYAYAFAPDDELACDLSALKRFPVHRFACSSAGTPACADGTFTVHNACAGPKSDTIDGRRVDTVANHIEANGDTGKQIVLAMDLDGQEWDTLMTTPDDVLEQVDQLPIEFHGVNERRFLEVVQRLKEQFYLVNLQFNNYVCTPEAAPLPAPVYKVLFVNKRLGAPDPDAPVPAPRSLLNVPANANAPDCQILTADDEARARDMRTALFTELQPVTLQNCRLARIGSPNDGGYLMCENLLAGLEAAYSYGIGSNDVWGCQVSTRFNVTTHQYDCFDPARPSCQGGRFDFHNACVGDRRETKVGRTFDTMASQISANGDTGKRLVVKMDVEGAEWDSLMATPDEVLERIDQIAIELHGISDPRFLEVVRKLKRQFYVVNLNPNNQACTTGMAPFSSQAHQALFVNKRIGVLDPKAPVPAPRSPLNMVDKPDAPPCAPMPVS
jgi:hypothetical protein